MSGESKISIVTVARAEGDSWRALLASLARMQPRDAIEVIVVNASGREISANALPGSLNAQVIAIDRNTRLTQARAVGIESCSGAIVAVLDERYTVTGGWLTALESAHREGVDVAGGPVAPRADYASAEWAMYLTEYFHLAPPIADRAIAPHQPIPLAGGNVSYTRRALALASMSSAGWEIEFHQALQNAGASFRLCGSMIAEFSSPPPIDRYRAERRARSRDQAARRVQGSNGISRILRSAALGALPPLLLARYTRTAMANPTLRAHFAQALPAMLEFIGIQMIAEMSGTLSGRTSTAEGD